jgi:hypothetical protein
MLAVLFGMVLMLACQKVSAAMLASAHYANKALPSLEG